MPSYFTEIGEARIHIACLEQEVAMLRERADSATERNTQLLAEREAMVSRMTRWAIESADDITKATIRDLTAKVEALEKRRAEACDECRGSGKAVWISGPSMSQIDCPDCHGTGAVIVDGDSKQEG